MNLPNTPVKIDQIHARHFLAELADSVPERELHQYAVALIRKELVERAIRKCDGNRSKAAQILNINRGSMRKYLQGPVIT